MDEMNNRVKAETWLRGASNEESWIDASSEYAKASLTRLLDEIEASEARRHTRFDPASLDSLDIESGLLDD